MKTKATRLMLFLSIFWSVTSSVLYFSATGRYYLFTPSDSPPIRVISKSDGKRYEVSLQSGAGYRVELYSVTGTEGKGGGNSKTVSEIGAFSKDGSDTEEPVTETIDKAISFCNEHLASLHGLPFWLREFDAISPVPIVNITFCYMQDHQFTGEAALKSAGFRVDQNWFGFSVFLLGPVTLVWLMAFVWAYLFKSNGTLQEGSGSDS